MIRVRSKYVLLVAPENFSVELLSDNKQFRHVFSANNIFPSIHEMKPDLVIFDYDHLVKDIEKVLRRIQTNQAYSKIKICCYKNKEHSKIDSLLKILGVDYIFYPADFNAPVKSKFVTNMFSLFEAPVKNQLAKATH